MAARPDCYNCKQMYNNGFPFGYGGWGSEHLRRKGRSVVLLEFSISPLAKGESVSSYVARSLEIIEASGLDYQLHAMGTIIEGEVDQVLDVMRKCLLAMAGDCDRISCTAKLDYRKGSSGRIKTKVASVEEKLGRTLRK